MYIYTYVRVCVIYDVRVCVQKHMQLVCISMYVCIYVFMYVFMYVCMYLCMYVCMYIQYYIYTHMCTYIHHISRHILGIIMMNPFELANDVIHSAYSAPRPQ